MWIIAIDVLGDFDVMFVPYQPYETLQDDCPEFGENGWNADDFTNTELYSEVFIFGTRF